MSKWHNGGKPVDRGPFRGCKRVRWRPRRGAPPVIGYLPGDQPKLKAAYDDYERRCWQRSESADAPEVHFADLMKKFLAVRDGSSAAVSEVELNKQTSMTLREWVGTTDVPGPFWQCTRSKGQMRTLKYHQVVAMLGELADMPMSELKSDHFSRFLDEQMACSTCVERAVADGKTPGADVPWSKFVPRLSAKEFDGQTCPSHRTTLMLASYESYRSVLRTLFAAALSDEAAERFGGQALVSYNPAPKAERLKFDDVILPRSEAEELRCGLTQVQVQLITDASPELYRAIPFFAAFTLNRGGQELTGMQIGQFSWVLTDDGHKVGCIELRVFHRIRRGGARVLSPNGKTPKSARTVFIPGFVGALIEEHIEKFRSTPSDTCGSCRQGIRHWGTPMRDDHGRNPHVGCDFAADSPLWIDEHARILDPAWYVKKVWHPACERAGLTFQNLGWKPQLKHSRSTGTTLHLEHGTDRAEVVRLGGWANEQMIADHYERLRKGSRARYAARFDAEANTEANGDSLEFQNRRLQTEVERLRGLCLASGIDPNGRLSPITVPTAHLPGSPTPRIPTGQPPLGKFGDRNRVIAAVVTAASSGEAPVLILKALGVAPAQKNYRRLAELCADAGMPTLSNGRQLPNGSKPVEVREWATAVVAWAARRETTADTG